MKNFLMKRGAAFILGMMLAIGAAQTAIAQAPPSPGPVSVVAGSVPLNASTVSARAALPGSATALLAVTIYNSGGNDVFCVAGTNTVVATTGSPIRVPANARVDGIYVGAATNIACVTASSTSTLVIWHANGPLNFGLLGGSPGGGLTSFQGRTTSAATLQAADVSGVGGLLASNNLSDVSSTATALTTLGGIGAGTTNTLTHKTFDTAGTGNVFKVGGTTITGLNGTGTNLCTDVGGTGGCAGGGFPITIGSTSIASGSTTTSISGLTLASPTFTGTVAGAGTVPNSVLANSAMTLCGTSTALGGSLTATSCLDNIGSTQGDLLYRNGANWTVLAPGTAGQLLQSGGAAANPSWITASGTGTVTSITGGAGILPSTNPCTTTCTLNDTVTNNAQTGTSYALLSTDGGKLVSANNGSAQAYSLSVASTGGFTAGYGFDLDCIGAGTVTLTATTSTFDNGLSSLVCNKGQDATVWSDSTNYHSALSLPVIANNHTLANTSGASNYPIDTTLTALIDAAIGSTQGNVLYRSSTAWSVLAPGTSGQFLQTQGAAANPIWASASGSGTVNSGTAGQMAWYAGTGTAVSGNANATISTGALSLGASGTVGSVSLGNATSGTVTLDTVTGALGSVNAHLPANTGILAELNLTQSWTALQKNCTTTLTISGSTFTPDGSCNNYKIVLVHASCPCTLANPSVDITGGDGRIQIVQSSTGSDTITTWGTNYKIAGGTSGITLSTAANAIDLFSIAGISNTEDDLAGPALNLTH